MNGNVVVLPLCSCGCPLPVTTIAASPVVSCRLPPSLVVSPTLGVSIFVLLCLSLFSTPSSPGRLLLFSAVFVFFVVAAIGLLLAAVVQVALLI